MRRLLLLPLVLLAALASLTLAPLSLGAVLVDTPDLGSTTNGIAPGADGNFYVSETAANQVVRVSATGVPVGDPIAIPGGPTAVSAGPAGTIWVVVPTAKQVVRIDTTATPAAVQTIDTSGNAGCDPQAIADGGDGHMYVTYPLLPACGVTSPRVGTIDAATGTVISAPINDDSYGLAGAGGQMYFTDVDTDAVCRTPLGTSPSCAASVTLPAGSGPQAIGVVGDQVWVGLYNTGQLAHFTVGATGAGTVVAPPAGTTFTSPTGIAADATGGVIATGHGSHNLLRVDADGTKSIVDLPAAAQPASVAHTADGAIVTDDALTAMHRLIDAKPVAGATTETLTTSTGTTFNAPVDSKGNDTTVVFEYGTTTAYGAQVAGAAVAQAGSAGSSTATVLSGLTPATTYHVRATVTNSRGTVSGPDATFLTATALGVGPTTKPKAKTCKVPKLKGLTVAKAKKKLKRAHCKAGKVKKVKTKTVKKGRVLSSSPKAGKKIKRTQKVALRVRK